MSSPSPAQTAQWVQCTITFIQTLHVLKFPCEAPPDIYMPASTVLQTDDGSQLYAFKWCYLNRRGEGRKTFFDVTSLSAERVRAMPQALTRLSKWFQFRNSRPQSVAGSLRLLALLLGWADQPQHGRRFEAILSKPDVALEALKGYHSYLRSKVQAHQIAPVTAGHRDQCAIACLSEIHDRLYKDHIEPLEARQGAGTKVPDTGAVAQFGSALQAIFDSAAALVLQGNGSASVRALRACASDNTKLVSLRKRYGRLRLMELACMAYSGLVFMDSGANEAVLMQYEEPDDLHEQLADPNRINLKEKSIKFRAGGKAVEVFLSATTVTRLKTYLQVRQTLVTALGRADIAPLFIRCEYGNTVGEPIAVRPLDRHFLHQLRSKVAAIGVTLPAVTLRQLRAYAQQSFVRTAPLAVAAKRMGHSVETAIKAYCKAQQVTHRGEMADYLGSLQRTVLDASELHGHQGNEATEIIPAGVCADYGHPAPAAEASAIQPDCSKVEGCFFCANFRVHADEEDMSKLMSCRRVLSVIAPLHGYSMRAEQVYNAVIGRIDALLSELRRRQPKVYEAIRVKVEERGHLTGYWARKLQQLHMLGMLPSEGSSPR